MHLIGDRRHILAMTIDAGASEQAISEISAPQSPTLCVLGESSGAPLHSGQLDEHAQLRVESGQAPHVGCTSLHVEDASHRCAAALGQRSVTLVLRSSLQAQEDTSSTGGDRPEHVLLLGQQHEHDGSANGGAQVGFQVAGEAALRVSFLVSPLEEEPPQEGGGEAGVGEEQVIEMEVEEEVSEEGRTLDDPGLPTEEEEEDPGLPRSHFGSR